MTFVDPATGKLLWKATFQNAEAQPSASGSVTGLLQGVTGVIYQNGKPVDNLTAPSVSVDGGKKIVKASGGVTVTSLTQKSTTLTSDTITWYTSQNKMIGLGHVVFKTGGFTQSGPSFLADTKIKNIVMPAPGYGHPAPLHVSFGQ